MESLGGGGELGVNGESGVRGENNAGNDNGVDEDVMGTTFLVEVAREERGRLL
jgi:hypothetical protein